MHLSLIVVELSPQTISKIVLRIDEDGGTDIGINKDADFTIVLQIEEKEPEYIEYGARNNIVSHSTPGIPALKCAFVFKCADFCLHAPGIACQNVYQLLFAT